MNASLSEKQAKGQAKEEAEPQSIGPARHARPVLSVHAPSLGAALLAITLFSGSLPAQADPLWAAPALKPNGLNPQSNLTRSAATTAGKRISVERAARIARRHTGGRVLSTSRVSRGDDQGVEVRMLVNGSRVTTLFVDSDGDVLER